MSALSDEGLGRIADFGRRVAGAHDMPHAFQVMHEALASLGFSDAIYAWGEFARTERPATELTFLMSYDRGLFDAYVGRGAGDDDYYALQCTRGTRLLTWGGERERAEMTDTQRACDDWLCSEIGDIGVTVPLGPGRWHGVGGLGLGADRGVSRAELTRYLTTHGDLVVQYALAFHHALHGSGLVADSFGLSRREREFLTWAARGYMAAEIADRMGCDVDWAYQISRRAQRKMKARNLAHAANKALIVGAIEP